MTRPNCELMDRGVSAAEMHPVQAVPHRQLRESAMPTVCQPLSIEIERFQQRAAILLAGWISLGVLALLMLPAARGFNEWVGWLPFWLLLAPATSLLILQRSRIAQWLRARPERHAVQRRRTAQARRPTRRGSGSALRTSLAALLHR